MCRRCRGTPDKQRHDKILALHLLRHVDHLVERRRDEPRQPDEIDILTARRLENLLARNHDTEIDHLVVIALEDDADNVLANVVYIAFHGRDDHPTVGLALTAAAPLLLLLLDEGDKMSDSLLHHPRAFHNLRQKHLSGAKQVTDDIHAVHQGTFDHLQRTLECEARLFGVLNDVVVDSLHEPVLESLCHRPGAPLQILLGFGGAIALELGRHLDEPLGRIRTSIEYNILDGIA